MESASVHPGNVLLFGRSAMLSRWLLILFGLIVMLCMGTVYAWSIFRTPLEQELAISATQSLLPFTLVLVFYALVMPIAGFAIPRVGTRRTTAIGGLVIGCGYILASFAQDIGSLAFCYGAIGGTGIGIVYGVPILVVSRWFPDRKGLAVGLTIVGFGLSPLITAPLANQLLAAYGVRPTLRLLGIAIAVIIVALSLLMRLPPRCWLPDGSTEPTPQASAVAPACRPRPLWRQRSFYALWSCYAIGTLVGLSAIGISSPVGQEIIAINPAVAASSVSLFALFNGVSRPLFGWLSDRFQPHHVALLSYGLVLIACVLMVNAQPGQVVSYLVAFSLFWFSLGGWLAMAPTITLRFFDAERYSQNYGIVFTAYGAGALVGTLLAGRLRDLFGSYGAVFYVMAALAILGSGIAALFLRRERQLLPGTSA
ncbi:OFA family MFS transporter [Synechococcus sp. RSCCF101]|uniref:L-lactate MFS transporter n=1 Tax=Synechococcus sp. RSCCF101 TaxID=2511069 RepID=UPI002105A443|nr:OFA family MFS transporter [Synechococcus sp. RSCCF101]